MKKILILLANPQTRHTPYLDLDRELKQVQQSLEYAVNHESFDVAVRWAATVDDLRRELLHERHQLTFHMLIGLTGGFVLGTIGSLGHRKGSRVDVAAPGEFIYNY